MLNAEKFKKEITYSSEYVTELENKIQRMEEEIADLKRRKLIAECSDAYYLEAYKKALETAIGDAKLYVGEWEMAIDKYNEQHLYDECINKSRSYIEGLAEFFFELIIKNESEKEWKKRKC